MSEIIVNASPKVRFQESSQNLSKHRDLITSNEFNRAMDVALLQYQAELSAKCTDQYAAMSNGLRMLGAQEFIQIVKNLAVTVQMAPRKVTDNLTPTN